MLGWIVFFALMTLFGISATAAEFPAPATASVVTSLVFSVLLVVTVLFRAIRDRA